MVSGIIVIIVYISPRSKILTQIWELPNIMVKGFPIVGIVHRIDYIVLYTNMVSGILVINCV